MKRQRLLVLGATGSIGDSTLSVVSRHSQFEVWGLTAHSNWRKMFELVKRWRPKFVAMSTESGAEQLRAALREADVQCEILAGPDGLIELAGHPDVDIVMAAIVGAAGLMPTLTAARCGKRILLANKESLVMAGEIFMQTARVAGATILPVDSEHNALFQALPNHLQQPGEKIDWRSVGVDKLVLTASGGPFLNASPEMLEAATPEQAVAHPNWSMGAKISVDSATLMNKGLEVIEACHLFDLPPKHVEVVIHPQSIVHSMVYYTDGSVLAQAGNPDMRTPIAHALAWPDRIDAGVEPLDLTTVSKLEFFPPDTDRFPCLRLAYECIRVGQDRPTVLNAANEEAVAAFLARRIGFRQIAEVVDATLNQVPTRSVEELTDILAIDQKARDTARHYIGKL
ncbi:MAG: 1-deoxy-D-xylulose-5-phosphate reductoisomerase [Gammaproteobacteria bacterium]|nr:MAG: 1-deoxy-D-xylulose-5-phosphate reductoisomerase [Gammaproteobacteria bacterium]